MVSRWLPADTGGSGAPVVERFRAKLAFYSVGTGVLAEELGWVLGTEFATG
jgi:hypothetical protein